MLKKENTETNRQNNKELPEDYLEIKAEVFRIIRANADERSPTKVMNKIKARLPDVSPDVIRQALYDLYT